MSRLRPEKLHVSYQHGTTREAPIIPRRYTLTHSDTTGELYLTIGEEYNTEQISGWYTRFMRDEVLAEWQDTEGKLALHVFCHVSGGLVFGRAGWRYSIFQREMPLVLQAIRYGDRGFFTSNPKLDHATVFVHFKASNPKYTKTENWGVPADYTI